MKQRLLFLLFALSACHHPLDCAVGGAFGALHTDCLPGTAGYEESPQRITEIMEDDEVCRKNSPAATARCNNHIILQKYKEMEYPRMDLVRLGMAKRSEIAEKQEKGKLTEAQAQLEMAEYGMRMAGSVGRPVFHTPPQIIYRSQNPPPYIPDNRPVSTTCNGYGGSINCTSQKTGIDASIYNNVWHP